MPFTPNFAIPYQTLADPPDGPNLGEDGFLAVDAALTTVNGRIDTLIATLLNTATVATQQGTASTTYTDLATVGPAVTVTIGSSGKALVVVTAFAFNGTVGAVSSMSYAVSGASTVAASDSWRLAVHSETVNGQGRCSAVNLHTGLTPGSTTFTAKYKTNSGSGNFADRSLIVVAL